MNDTHNAKETTMSEFKRGLEDGIKAGREFQVIMFKITLTVVMVGILCIAPLGFLSVPSVMETIWGKV